MGTTNAKAIEKLAIIGTIDPQTCANTELFSDVIDMSKFHQVIATLLTGDMANETVDFKCYRCASDGNSAVELKKATQRAASASANDNIQIAINVRADELMASGAQYVKFSVQTGNTTGGPAAVLIQGVDARFDPASDANLASVKELVG
ncbi:MAG: hypothetical protein ACM3Y9_07690 [Ignavibacteria bacterium]